MQDQKKIKRRTLQHSLLWLISALLLLLLLGSFVFNIHATRNYLERQLHSHSQDAATSLGLSLSTSIDARDEVTAGRIIDAIFDSGDYRRIVLFDLKGSAIVIRNQPLLIDQVPTWFIEAIHLSAPAQSSQVVSGWKQLGTVVVESHPGYAYLELWQVMQSQFIWFAMISIIGLLVTRSLLASMLKPLEQLEFQARQMSVKHFDVRAPIPKARELAGVAQAMNMMADHLGQVFQEQLTLIDGLRAESFIDALTGLSNREGFDARLKAELDSKQREEQGGLILIQLNDFEQVNKRQGRVAANTLLQKIASILTKLISGYPNAFLARRGGVDFSIFLPSLMADDIDVIAQKLMLQLNGLSEIKHLLRDDFFHMGIACVLKDDTSGILLSKADMALRQAQLREVSGWQRYANIKMDGDPLSQIYQADEWRHILQNALASRSIRLHTQTVFDANKRQLYQQLLSRIELKDELVVANMFLPMAERFQMMVPFDRFVLEKVIESLLVDLPLGDSPEYCMTISAASLGDDVFLDWFSQQMSSYPEVAKKLMFEISEYVIAHNEAAVIKLSEFAQRYGFGISIERFGVSSVSFSYLQYLHINIIKVDHSFIREIQSNQSNQFFLRSAVQIAHGQSIKVVAVGVETEEEWVTLNTLGLDGAMGYYLERPKVNKVFEA